MSNREKDTKRRKIEEDEIIVLGEKKQKDEVSYEVGNV